MPGSRAEQKLIGPRLTGNPPCRRSPKRNPRSPVSPRPGLLPLRIVQCKMALTFIVQRNKPLSINPCRPPGFFERTREMIEPIQKASEDFQKLSKDNFDATVRSYAELNKGFQAIAAKMTDYSKQAFEDATRAFEQLAGAKSLEHVFEIQSQYAKKAYDTWVAEASKLGEMYAAVARDAYKPVEKAVSRKVS